MIYHTHLSVHSRERIMGRSVCQAVALVLCICIPSLAPAANMCRARVVLNVRPQGGSGEALHTGQLITGLYSFKRAKNGVTSFCFRDGRCFPTRVANAKGRSEAIRLLNCIVDVDDMTMEDGNAVYSIGIVDSPATRCEILLYQGFRKRGLGPDRATEATKALLRRSKALCGHRSSVR